MSSFAQVVKTFEARNESGASWLYLAMWWMYFFASLYGIFHAAPIFRSLFAGLDVELRLPTRFLLATYWWLCPLVFVSILALTLCKKFFVANKNLHLAIDVYLVVLAILSGPVMVFVLYWPLFDVIHKLEGAR
ncbi:MAG: hypothetical protein NVS9B14_07790 [Candidatus Acidiferrum sp.]